MKTVTKFLSLIMLTFCAVLAQAEYSNEPYDFRKDERDTYYDEILYDKSIIKYIMPDRSYVFMFEPVEEGSHDVKLFCASRLNSISPFEYYPDEVSIPSSVEYEGEIYKVVSIGDAYRETAKGPEKLQFSYRTLIQQGGTTSDDVYVRPTDEEQYTFKTLILPFCIKYIEPDSDFGRICARRFAVDPSNPNYMADGKGVLYSKDGTTLISFPALAEMTVFHVPDNVSALYPRAFAYSNTPIFLNDNIRILPDYCFVGYDLEGLDLPDSILEIGECCFRDSKITHINLPKAVETIKDATFLNSNLHWVSLPESLCEICGYAFISYWKGMSFGEDGHFHYETNARRSLEGLVFRNSTIPVVSRSAFFDRKSFKTYSGLCIRAYVAPSSVSSYQNAARGWSDLFVVGEYEDRMETTIYSSRWADRHMQLYYAAVPLGDVSVTEIEWSSDDSSIVSIDKNGLAEAIGDGETIIRGKITDTSGNVYEHERKVKGSDGIKSGIAETLPHPGVCAVSEGIYTLQGTKVKDTSRLAPGLYIRISNGKAEKLLLR